MLFRHLTILLEGGVGGPAPDQAGIASSSEGTEILLADAKLARLTLIHAGSSVQGYLNTKTAGYIMATDQARTRTKKTKPRTNRIIQRVVRMSIEEDLAVKAKATGAGYSSNAKFLRECALGKKMRQASKIDPVFQKQIWRQVSGIGRNINQIAFKFNSDTWVAPDEFKSILEEIKALRKDLESLGLDPSESSK